MDLKGNDNILEPDTAISREIELKLRASPEALDVLLASPLLAAGIPGLASEQTLDAAYYDTADLRLHQRGVSLRVRGEGNRFIQTVKTGSAAAGALERREWQTVVPDLNPRPDWVMDAGARAMIRHLAPDELQEICRTSVRRETRVVGYKHNGEIAIIEIDFDRGTLAAGDRSAPTADIELELLKGSKQALYALALELHDIAPVRVEVRSKAERAYALFTGEPPPWRKAKPLRFARRATVDGGITAVFESCFSHWMANEPAVLESGDPEAIHQMRVALRRMRSALTLFDGVLPPMQAGWLKGESQWVGDALGGARNWDVFLADVLAPLAAKRPGDKSLTALREQCEKARARNYEIARAAILSPRYTAFVLNFNRWLDEAAWHATANATRREILGAPLKAFADTLFERNHRGLAVRGRKLAAASPERRHQFRLAVKRMRYASEFFVSLYGAKKSRAMLGDLSRLQGTLGDLNDLALAEHQLETMIYQAAGHPAHNDILKATGLVVGWCTARTRQSEIDVLDQWKRFKRRQPFWKRIAKR